MKGTETMSEETKISKEAQYSFDFEGLVYNLTDRIEKLNLKQEDQWLLAHGVEMIEHFVYSLIAEADLDKEGTWFGHGAMPREEILELSKQLDEQIEIDPETVDILSAELAQCDPDGKERFGKRDEIKEIVPIKFKDFEGREPKKIREKPKVTWATKCLKVTATATDGSVFEDTQPFAVMELTTDEITEAGDRKRAKEIAKDQDDMVFAMMESIAKNSAVLPVVKSFEDQETTKIDNPSTI